jgi:hypothetical protein
MPKYVEIKDTALFVVPLGRIEILYINEGAIVKTSLVIVDGASG